MTHIELDRMLEQAVARALGVKPTPRRNLPVVRHRAPNALARRVSAHRVPMHA